MILRDSPPARHEAVKKTPSPYPLPPGEGGTIKKSKRNSLPLEGGRKGGGDLGDFFTASMRTGRVSFPAAIFWLAALLSGLDHATAGRILASRGGIDYRRGTSPTAVGIDPTTNGWVRLGRLTRASFPRGQQEEAEKFARLIFAEYNENSPLAKGRVISLKFSLTPFPALVKFNTHFSP